MKKNELEKHFREGLKNVEAGPPDGVKSSVEKHLVESGMLQEKSESRGGLWLIALLALLIITPVVMMVTKKHKAVVNKEVAVNEQAKAEQNTAQNHSANSLAKERKSSDGKQQVSNETGNEQGSVERTSKSSAIPQPGLLLKGKEASSKESRKKNRKSLKSESAVTLLASNEQKHAKNTNHKSKANEGLAENIKSENATPKESKQDTAPTKEKAKENENSAMPTPGLTAQVNTAADSSANEEKQKPAELDTLEKKPVKDSTAKSKTPPVKEKGYTNVNFDFSGAPQFNTFKYGNGAISDNDTYIQHSQQSEKPIPTFSAAFGLVVTTKHLVFETGIRHSTIESDFSYTDTYYIIDTTGAQPDTTTGHIHYIATNKMSFVEFPVLVGYQFHVQKFDIEVKSGALVGYIKSANTTTFSLSSGDVVRYDGLDDSPYTKVNWSYLGALQVLYPIGGRFSVFMQPSLKVGLNSIFKDNYSVTKKVQSTTVALGLRVRL